MSEILFEDLFTHYGKRAYLHKLTDTKEVSGLNGRPTTAPDQPSDYIVTLDGETFFAEVKSSEGATSFPFKNIRPSQYRGARQQLAVGGTYLFYILRTKTGAWFRVPAKVILEWPRKSMTWVELEPYRI